MKICVLTHLSTIGSGYSNLTLPILTELTNLGHEIKVVGIENQGEQHNFPFPIFPVQENNLRIAMAVVQNILNLWNFDVFLCALDIPVQEMILKMMGTNRPFKYVGILPVEAPPLCMSWALVLMQMDKAFIISKFGTAEALKLGLQNAEYLELGIDTNIWRRPIDIERKSLRQAFGIEQDAFVVLTVADNQERKNLAANLEAFAKFVQSHPNVPSKYILSTRMNLPVGWKLDDLAQELGILDKMIFVERGMPFRELWGFYAMADAFLLLSKAEGLGMPLLEAMATGLPCVATDCTGMRELLGQERGYLVPYLHEGNSGYSYIDPFGNGRRWLASTEIAAAKLSMIYNSEPPYGWDTVEGFLKDRTWKATAETVQKYLLTLGENNA